MPRLTEKTWVPLGLAVSTIGGAAFWLASLSGRVEAAEQTIVKYERMMEKAVEIAVRIEQRVSRIEGYLERLPQLPIKRK